MTSIPSTPRPARQAPPTDSATTRLTRFNGSQPSAAQPLANDAIAATPMFSAGSLSNAPLAGNTVEDLTLGKPDLKPEINPVTETETALDQSLIDQGFVPNSDLDDTFSRTVDDISADSSFVSSEADKDFDAQLKNRLDEANGTAAGPETTFDSPDLGAAVPASTVEADFANQVAAFDQANLNQTHPGETSFTEAGFTEPDLGDRSLSSPESSPANPSASSVGSNGSALNNQAALGNAQSNQSFDDGLPAAFTTEAEASPFRPETSLQPVGVEYDRNDQPNLKPFIIGGVVAAIAAGAIILASMLGGGGNRQPSVANSPEPSNEVVQSADVPPVPAETAPKEAVAPPVSTAPVYVEATATAEAWVSIITDGTTTFEGTLQPGDRKVWEAQKSINVYSANAGGLEVAANGGKPEVMGKPGQLAEKNFTQ